MASAQDDCGNLVPGDYHCQIVFDQEPRTFEVHVPASVAPERPVPLVIDMHGRDYTSGEQRELSGWEAKADLEGFIAAWPQGVDNVWDSQGECCLFTGDRDDAGFIEAVVSEIAGAANIDQDRVYATGFSNGGSQSHTMACEAADVLAAVAPVAYLLSGGADMAEIIANCTPSEGIPVIQFQGTADDRVDYETGVYDSLGAQESLTAWSVIQSCDFTVAAERISPNTLCETHSNCIDGAAVTLCTVDQGPHVLYPAIQETTIPDVAWAFFESYAVREPGDANGDGVVDGADYTIWADNYALIGAAGPSEGDFNDDDVVDGADYTIWADNYGAGMGSSGGAGAGRNSPAAELPACGPGLEWLLVIPALLASRKRRPTA